MGSRSAFAAWSRHTGDPPMMTTSQFTAGPRHGLGTSLGGAFAPQLAGGVLSPVALTSPASFSPGRIHLSRRGQARGIHARRFQLQRDALAVRSTSSAPPCAHSQTMGAKWKSLTPRTVSLAANTGGAL
jgi:hypothetical protein